MKRWKWNYLVDALMFISMMALAGIGLLLKYVVLEGRETRLKYGLQTNLEFLGLDRHEWGTIHFIISLVLLSLLILHIILHWSMIVTLYRRFVPAPRLRFFVTWGFTGLALLLIGFPLVAQPSQVAFEPLRRFTSADSAAVAGSDPATLPRTGQGLGRRAVTSPAESASPPASQTVTSAAAPADSQAVEEHEEHTLEIQGYMTVQQVATRYGVPAEHIVEELGVNERNAIRERLGQLRRRYGFTMTDVEQIILKYLRDHPPPGDLTVINR